MSFWTAGEESLKIFEIPRRFTPRNDRCGKYKLYFKLGFVGGFIKSYISATPMRYRCAAISSFHSGDIFALRQMFRCKLALWRVWLYLGNRKKWFRMVKSNSKQGFGLLWVITRSCTKVLRAVRFGNSKKAYKSRKTPWKRCFSTFIVFFYDLHAN